MSLFDQLGQYDVPQSDQPPAPEFTCKIKSTRAGQQIMLCSVEPAPQAAIDDAVAAGLALFVPSEVAVMTDIDSQTLGLILAAKKVYPGCDVQQIIREAVAQ